MLNYIQHYLCTLLLLLLLFPFLPVRDTIILKTSSIFPMTKALPTYHYTLIIQGIMYVAQSKSRDPEVGVVY